MILLHLNVE